MESSRINDSTNKEALLPRHNTVIYTALPVVEYPAQVHEKRPSCTCTIPKRFWIGVMAFFGCAINFVLRSNISINILAMVLPQNETIVLPDHGPRYAWTPYEQSTVLGAFFYGSTSLGIPFGLLVDRFGIVRHFMLGCCLLSAVLEAISPLVAWSFAFSFVVRLLLGMAQGIMYPGMHKLFTKWSPPNELGRFMSSMMGGNFGTIVSWAMSGFLIESLGWVYSFYGAALLTLLFCAGWWWTAFDTPAQHPRIAAAEREYIEESLLEVKQKPSWTPVGKLLTSVPVWAMIVLQYGNLWAFMFVITGAPKFMNEILGFTLSGTGLVASLPYVARWLGGTLFAFLCDCLRKRDYMSLMNLRRLMCVFSHIIPGLFLAGLPYASSNPYVCVAFMTLSFGFNGAVTQTAFANVHDLSPNYAASILSFSNAIGGTSGFITPLVVTYFTADNNTFEGWRNVFLIGAAVYIVPAIVFMWLGSASVQPWNNAVVPADEIADKDRVVSGDIMHKNDLNANCDASPLHNRV